MTRTKTIQTEEVFLLSTFSEFVKCWKSSKRSRLFFDSVNGEAFVNFSVFLGNPNEAHSYSTPRQRNPPPEEKKKKKKSFKKIQRDNERAAKFQEKKRQEEAAAKAASGVPPSATSSPAASSVRAASVNFSFASPAPEDVTNGTIGISDPSPSPEDLHQQPDAMEGILSPHPGSENLRQQLEDPPSFTFDFEEIAREDHTELTVENISISEENQETASEETESPGLDFWTLKLSQSELWGRRIYKIAMIRAQQEHQEKLKRMLQSIGQMLEEQNAK